MSDGAAMVNEAPETFESRLARAAAKLNYLQKTGKNTHFKYSFVTEAHVKEKVKEALESVGLVLRSVMYAPIGECSGKAATLLCTVIVVGTDGGMNAAQFQGVGSGTDSSDKAPMKACAAALKYALTSGFLIPTGDDPEDDGSEPTDDKPAATPAAEKSVTEVANLLIERVKTAPTAADLATLKVSITALKGRSEDEFNRVVEVYRQRAKEVK
jgi:hypothetical protein